MYAVLKRVAGSATQRLPQVSGVYGRQVLFFGNTWAWISPILISNMRSIASKKHLMMIQYNSITMFNLILLPLCEQNTWVLGSPCSHCH